MEYLAVKRYCEFERGCDMKKNRRGIDVKSRGFGIVGWLLMIPVAVVVLLVLAVGFYEGRKAYWNSKVKEMCEKDAGTKVFQTIELNEQQYVLLINKFGKLDIPDDKPDARNAPIVRKETSTYIRRNDPEVRRDQLVVIRKSDQQILGTRVTYSRVGGDLIALHPSYFSCPEESVDLFAAVVHMSKEQK